MEILIEEERFHLSGWMPYFLIEQESAEKFNVQADLIEKDGPEANTPIILARKHLLLTVGTRSNEGFPSLARRDDCDNVTRK